MDSKDEAALKALGEYYSREVAAGDHWVLDAVMREAFALGRASGWQAAVQALAIHKPYGTYNNCRLCGSTWWDGKREEHRFDCVTRTDSPLVTDDQRASALTVQPSPASHGKDAASSADARWKEDATPAPSRSERASVSGERDGERCAREGCGFPANANVHNRCHAKPCGIDCHEFQPTDRNAGRDAALAELESRSMRELDSRAISEAARIFRKIRELDDSLRPHGLNAHCSDEAREWLENYFSNDPAVNAGREATGNRHVDFLLKLANRIMALQRPRFLEVDNDDAFHLIEAAAAVEAALKGGGE